MGHETSLIAGAFYEALKTKTTAARIYRVVIKRRGDLWLSRFIRRYSQSWCTSRNPSEIIFHWSIMYRLSFWDTPSFCILRVVIFYARPLSSNPAVYYLLITVRGNRICRFCFLDATEAAQFLHNILRTILLLWFLLWYNYINSIIRKTLPSL